jgi:hypothetical protein
MDLETCVHGTAWDVHCCGCHSGFLFDISSCSCTGWITGVNREADHVVFPLREDEQRVSYWRHKRCNTKIQFVGADAYCPSCRRSVHDGAEEVVFSNPECRVIPNRGSDAVDQLPVHTWGARW